VDEWAQTKPKEVAEALAPLTGLNTATLERALVRGGFGVSYLNDKVIAEQQKIADTFYELKLIPKQLNIREVVWLPQQKK
jgi:sulfonate transport system substrate-binding protein